jgi:uncharacterized protein (TIGR03437 family)
MKSMAPRCGFGSMCLRGVTRRLLIAMCFGAGWLQGSGNIYSAAMGGSGQDYATAVASDSAGNVYVVGLTYSPDFPVTAGAVQTKFGGTSDAFVSKLGPDGKRIWSTYLGGILDDWATGVALDSSGNILVTGWTRSANFPLLNPIQGALDSGATDNYDAFVTKLDPNGAKLLYSTFLGGAKDDGAAGITVDSGGNAYVAVSTNSATGFPGLQNGPDQFGIVVTKLNPQGAITYSFFHPNGQAGGIALDAAGAVYVAGSVGSTLPSSTTKMFGTPGAGYAIAFKISPDGSKKIFDTGLGGSVQAGGTGIAVNGAGEVYVAGTTSSVDFPLAHPLQTSPGARPVFKSTDSGATWKPFDDLPFAATQVLAADPTNANTLYVASSDLGVFKSVDGGATWTKANSGIASTNVTVLAIDPVHSQTLYAATAAAVYKSVDGANTWSAIDTLSNAISRLLVDAQNPNIVYEVGNAMRKSTDGGATWNAVTFPQTFASAALDPRVSGHIFAVSNLVFGGSFGGTGQNPYLYRSVDGGATWIQVSLTSPTGPGLVVDGSTNPSTIYNGMNSLSVDGGVTWAAIPTPPFQISSVTTLAVDTSGNLYAAAAGVGVFVSHDHAKTWTQVGTPVYNANLVKTIVPVGAGSTIYATSFQVATSGFVSKLSADGGTLEFSTYLRGHATSVPSTFYAAEPNVFTTQTWISSVAVDGAGNAVVAGGTRASDFPVASPSQAANAGLSDAFATIIAADGSQIKYSTYFGGSLDDGALGVAVDSSGNVIIAGQTWSGDFPVDGGLQPPTGLSEAFVIKLATGPPVIGSVVNGGSYQGNIAPGSWVAIKGSNLSTTTGTWVSADFSNGNLPTSLDGVSVTIGGKPAFVYYISPTQINVQAPDVAAGTVSVVVTLNGVPSAPAAAQLQPAAPAFFQYGATNTAIASRLPDYAVVGDPSVEPGAVAAKPGDLVILWGTGFGPTSPAVPAGTTVSGAPAVTPAPTVTVGGVPAQVISAMLTTGTAGLYQVTIQLPANTPAGSLAVQASVGGVSSPEGVTIFVGR